MQTGSCLELRMSVEQDGDKQSVKHDAAAQDSICSNAFSYEPPRVQLFALRRHIGFFAYLEHAIWVATHPGWLSLSLEPWLHCPGVAPSCTASNIAEGPDCVRLHPHYDNGDDGYQSPFYAYLDYGTLILTPTMTFAQALTLDFGTLTMISRCEPFMARFYFAGIVDELLLCAAIVHLIFGTVGRLPQCISAHNCDTETILRLMSFLDPYIGSSKRSPLCSVFLTDTYMALLDNAISKIILLSVQRLRLTHLLWYWIYATYSKMILSVQHFWLTHLMIRVILLAHPSP